MVYIHEKPGWPKLRLGRRCPRLHCWLAVRHKQGRLLGKMEALGFDLRSEASLTVLTSDVVKSSAIEGEPLNPEEVRSSIARRLGLDVAGLPKAGRDVEGVVEMMLDATRNFAAPLTKERLFAWHASLFPTGRSGMTRSRSGHGGPTKPGRCRSSRVRSAARRCISKPPHADRLESEMSGFIDWFNAPTAIDPVLKAGIAHFWFVTIHPFEDGNGRIARAIADMALARADGTTDRFYSMSSQIAAERKDYYRELEAAQRGDVNITPWLAWFLDASAAPSTAQSRRSPRCSTRPGCGSASIATAGERSAAAWSSTACSTDSKGSSRPRSTPSSPNARRIRRCATSGNCWTAASCCRTPAAGEARATGLRSRKMSRTETRQSCIARPRAGMSQEAGTRIGS